MQLSRKWSIGAVLVAVVTFIAHPEECVSISTIVSWFPNISEGTVVSVASLLLTIIAALGDHPLKKNAKTSKAKS